MAKGASEVFLAWSKNFLFWPSRDIMVNFLLKTKGISSVFGLRKYSPDMTWGPKFSIWVTHLDGQKRCESQEFPYLKMEALWVSPNKVKNCRFCLYIPYIAKRSESKCSLNLQYTCPIRLKDQISAFGSFVTMPARVLDPKFVHICTSGQSKCSRNYGKMWRLYYDN